MTPLFDHTGSVHGALAEWLPAIGASSSPTLIRAWFDLEQRHFESWRAGLITFDEQRRRRLRDFLPLIGNSGASTTELDALFARYLHCYDQSWAPFDDVRPALEALAARHVVVAVLTNGTIGQQAAKIEAIGVRDHLALVVTSEELGVAKPDPDAYLAVCNRLQVNRGRTLHVSDRHDLDVVPARAAGLRALHLDRRQQHREPPEGRIPTLAKLPARISSGSGADGRGKMSPANERKG